MMNLNALKVDPEFQGKINEALMNSLDLNGGR